MRVLIVAPDADWRAPLAALLRESGAAPIECDDPLAALSQLRQPARAIVVSSDIGDHECLLLAGAARKRLGSSVRLILAGSGTPPLHTADSALSAGFDDFFPLAHRFRAIRDSALMAGSSSDGASAAEALTAHPGPAAVTPSLAELPSRAAPTRSATDPAGRGDPDLVVTSQRPAIGSTPPASASPLHDGAIGREPFGAAELQRLLHLARHESYFSLLELRPDAAHGETEAAISTMQRRLDGARTPAGATHDELAALREIRAVFRDAAAVLSSPRGRAAYATALGFASHHGA